LVAQNPDRTGPATSIVAYGKLGYSNLDLSKALLRLSQECAVS